MTLGKHSDKMHTVIRMINLILRSFLFKPVPSFAVLLTHSFSHLAWKTQQLNYLGWTFIQFKLPCAKNRVLVTNNSLLIFSSHAYPDATSFSVFSAFPLSFVVERCLLLSGGEGRLFMESLPETSKPAALCFCLGYKKALIVSVDEVCWIYWHFKMACLLLL